MNGSKYDSEIANFVVVLNNLFYRLFLFFLSQWVYNCFLFCNNCFWHVHNVKHDVSAVQRNASEKNPCQWKRGHYLFFNGCICVNKPV